MSENSANPLRKLQTQSMRGVNQNGVQQIANDADYEFLEMAGLLDVNQDQLDQALENFDVNEISFDVFVFC